MSAPASPAPPRRRAVALLDLDAVVRDAATRIVVCCGSGGVGKTTTAAAVALRAAEQGRTVAVLTIDPARRLAQAMGLDAMGNEPHRVPVVGDGAGGSLDAMMLDMKRTFDGIVLEHSTPERAALIFANPFYQSLSSSFAGTQEYMAMERLGQLQAQGDWDLIVVDTPPSRSALDFLDAPKRLGSFLDGRFIRLLTAPAKAGGRAYLKVFSAGVGAVTGVLGKVLGGQMLHDLQGFIAALDTMFGGFRERAEATYELLRAPGTSFVVVAAPEPDALREASYFVDRLAGDGMPLAGLVLNRVHTTAAPRLSAARATEAAERLEESSAGSAEGPDGERALTAELLRLHAQRAALVRREQRLRERFVAAHPSVPVVEVRARPGDVHDLDGLRDIGRDLAREAVPG